MPLQNGGQFEFQKIAILYVSQIVFGSINVAILPMGKNSVAKMDV